MERDRSGRFMKTGNSKKQITVQLKPDELDELDNYCEFNGLSRNQGLSRAIRLLVDSDEAPIEERKYLSDREMCELYGVEFSIVERWREGEMKSYLASKWQPIKNGWLSK